MGVDARTMENQTWGGDPIKLFIEYIHHTFVKLVFGAVIEK
jgi:hypothetical protein